MALYDFNAALKPVESPINQYAQLQQLKTMQGQQQLQQQALQTGGLENQQRQMDLDSQRAIMRAYTEANGDTNAALPLAQKYGAKPADLINLKMLGIKQQEAALQLVGAQGSEALRQADLMKGAHDAVAAAPPEQRNAAYQQQLMGLHQGGVDVSQLPVQYPGDQAFAVLGAGVASHKVQVEDALKTSEIGKNTAQAGEAQAAIPEKQATTAKTQLETQQLQQSGGNPAMQEARYRTILSRLAAKQPVSADDMAFAKGYEASQRKTTTQSDSLGVTSVNSSAPSGLASVMPRAAGVAGAGSGAAKGSAGGINAATAMNADVDMIGQYKMNPTLLARLIAKHGEIPALVLQKYPDFDQVNYNAKNRMQTYMTSGQGGQNLTAFNTAIAHAQQLNPLIDALKNGDVVQANKLGNALGYQFGNNATTNYNVVKNALVGEVSKVFKGGGATDAEIAQVSQPLSNANSPEQLKGAVQQVIHLMNSRRDALKNQYQSGMQGQPNFGGQQAQPMFATNPQTKQRIQSNDGGKTWQPAQ